ncbi:MAG: RluA family pseudouridine synthase [Pseudomonadota bacterium]
MAAVEPPEPLIYRPPTDPWLTLVYEDRHVIAANKPAGLLAVPGKPADHQDCLEARVEARFPEARIVHRLDRPTSGLVLFGRGAAAHARLSLAFEQRRVAKTYIARVSGLIEDGAGEIDAPVCADWPRRPRQMIHPTLGKPALTRWRVLAREADPTATRVALEPQTGRTHQLRLHMAWLGHPILGDGFYAPPEARAAADRLQLHAERLSLEHPVTGEPLALHAPCPF